MAFLVEDDGSFKIDDSGNYMVDDGATIITYMPPQWAAPDDPTVEAEYEPSQVIELVAVGIGSITWELGGPDSDDFDLNDNLDGTADLVVPGSGEYEITVTATNSVGQDVRTLLISITSLGGVVQILHAVEQGSVGFYGLHGIEVGSI
jgi:hypothetical protein